jgi:hypothetical protein
MGLLSVVPAKEIDASSYYNFILFYMYPFSVPYLFLNIFEGMNLRGSPGLLRVHPCRDLPITRIQPEREWLLNVLWSDLYTCFEPHKKH